MSKSTKFPAQFLSAYDIGKRVRVVTTGGATITDRLTSVMAKERGVGLDGRVAVLFVTFENVCATDGYRGGHELDLNSWVKRIG